MSGQKEDSPLSPGQIIAGRYKIHRMLGRGGMGAVFEAEHLTLNKKMCVKVLLSQLTEDEEAVARFMQEARAAAGIGHPGIVEVFDLGTEDGLTYLAMELLRGEELAARVQRGHPLAAGFVARIGADLADAVAAAHELGIVHRDLKPQNIFLAKAGRREDVVKVLDFGLAKLLAADRADAPQTRSGQVFGTPLYMSPEQILAPKEIDGRTDVYAMGAILYESLAGRPPFVAETYGELVLKVAHEGPAPLSSVRADLPEPLYAIVEKAMQKEPADRFQAAEQLAGALEEVAHALGFEQLGSSSRRSGSQVDASALAATMPSSSSHPVPGKPLQETPFTAETTPEPPERRSSRKGLLAALTTVAVLLTAGTTASVLWLGGDDDRGEVTPAASGPAEPRPSIPGGKSPTKVEPTEPTQPSTTTPVPSELGSPPGTTAVETVSLEVVTRPPGAEVRVGTSPPCKSPCTTEVPQEDTQVTATLRGYRRAQKHLGAPLPPRVALTLQKAPQQGAPRPPAQPRPTAPAKTPPPLLER